ncbi:MAG: glycosyltransferase [Leeuwenhoekiella sp.]
MPQLSCPIVLFTYNRLENTKKVVESLLNNHCVKEANLFIFSDGPKNESALIKVNLVREFLKTIKGFKSVEIIEAENNLGLANSIISGVTHVLKNHNSVIVLEDDLIVSQNFLKYMNEALNYYVQKKQVISIAGYRPPFHIENSYKYDTFFARRNTSWGWATWRDRWELIEWNIIRDKDVLGSPKKKYGFFKLGANLLPMYHKQKRGLIDSWAIRFSLNQYKLKMYTVFPVKNKVLNIGFGADATHTAINSGFNNNLDTTGGTDFHFPNVIKETQVISRQFYREYSLYKKIKNILKK